MYKLTEYSHGAGCGCKLSPGVLQDILSKTGEGPRFDALLVGNETADDAAIVRLDQETGIVSTTDFFMPIVDDAHDFGAIAATNAISDIYAMGASPILAIAILGWPINQLPGSEAARVLAGAREVCTRAGIPLAGGHSIDSPEPIFGLAVTGRVGVNDIKMNGHAEAGDKLYLTKPIGIGLVTTAQKKKHAEARDLALAQQSMLTLNSVGAKLSKFDFVHGLTDVTGFGLAGHLVEVCEAAGLQAQIKLKDVPTFDFVEKYIELDCIPGGTYRNWDTYGHKVKLPHHDAFKILADPQTSGGLLVTVDNKQQQEFEDFMTNVGFVLQSFGYMFAGDGEGDVVLEVD